jgi:hypothetical protein
MQWWGGIFRTFRGDLWFVCCPGPVVRCSSSQCVPDLVPPSSGRNDLCVCVCVCVYSFCSLFTYERVTLSSLTVDKQSVVVSLCGGVRVNS